MGVLSSPHHSPLTMRAFLTVILAVACRGERTYIPSYEALLNGVLHSAYGYSHPVIDGESHPYLYGKREAEAEPFYGYNAGVVPYVHHAGIVAPTALGHAVAVTGYGHVTHSSNVGVCTNVAGVQVPC